MRIVGGRFRGHALKTPSSKATRPTSDRLRETVFNVLAHAYGDPVPEARVLDLFAGTGALGLEALSRGARFALFVEDAAEPRGLIRDNIDTLGLAGSARLFRRDATKLGPAKPVEPFDIALLDPPYRKGLAERALAAARDGGWLKPEALCVVEEAVDADFRPPDCFTVLEQRVYGDTQLTFLRFGDA